MPIILTPEQERKLTARAARAQKSVDAILGELLDDHTTNPAVALHDSPEAARVMHEVLVNKPLETAEPVPDAESLALLAMLQEWREEDATMTEEEIEESEKDWQELKASLNANRLRNGEEPLFP